jgi:hypothetical protein
VDTPSIRDHPARYLDTAYRHARTDAPDATGLPLAIFPAGCPWPVAQGSDEDFWPQACSMS